jgi:hypothetical protein
LTSTTSLGHQIVQEPQPLGHDFRGEKIDAGRVAARPGKTGDETQLDRVFGDDEDDWDRRGRSFCRLRRGWAERGDYRHLTPHEIGHERRHAIVLALEPMVFDHHVLALDVAGFVETFTERSRVARGDLDRTAAHDADHRHRRLLRERRERPAGCRAAEKRDKRAPF